MFSTLYGTYFPFKMHSKMSSAICFDLDQSKILPSGNGLIAIADNINVVQIINLVFDMTENMGGKKKMLVNGIFSFSHNLLKRVLSQSN